MATQLAHSDTQKAILAAREAQRLTMRDFATALEVSHNAVYQWESGIAAPTQERIAEWLRDERLWVKQLGLKLFHIRYGAIVASAADSEPPIAA